jgi:hypothetical protein
MLVGITLPDNFSDRSAGTDTKRLAKPFYKSQIMPVGSINHEEPYASDK